MGGRGGESTSHSYLALFARLYARARNSIPFRLSRMVDEKNEREGQRKRENEKKRKFVERVNGGALD